MSGVKPGSFKVFILYTIQAIFLALTTFLSNFALGSQLKMSLVSCDGGEKDKNSKAENVLSDNWTSEGRLDQLVNSSASTTVYVIYTI